MGRDEKAAALTTALGIAISVLGRFVATWFNMPLWLDSMGTVLVAYRLGPIAGAVAGISSNVIFSAMQGNALWYGLTSAALGIVVGTMTQRDYFKTLFGAATVGTVSMAVAVVVSVPLNMAVNGGYTNNQWGDGVIDYLSNAGLSFWLSAVLGEFYLDFIDKMFVALLVFGIVRAGRELSRRLREAEAPYAKEGGAAADATKKKLGGTAVLVLSLLAASAAPARVQAQEGASARSEADFYSYVQQVYGNSNGLPCGEANDIAETKDGVLWIGTYAGLYRYNGREFRLMGDFDSVKNVNCLYVDEEGRLWIGTNDKGLSLCVGEHVNNVIDSAAGLPSDSIRDIVRCSDGTYYVATSDAMQVMELNGGIKMLERIPEVTYADSLTADNHGNVAAVTSTGELFVLGESAVKLRATLGEEAGAGVYTCCLFDDYGRLYVGTSTGSAFLYDISTGALRELNRYDFEGLQEMNCLLINDEGVLFGCADNGIAAFVPGRGFTPVHTGQFNNSIDHMIMDYQGNYWFSSSRLGVLKMTKSIFSDLYEMAQISRKVVNSTALWQGLLYVGTDAGLDVLDLVQERPVENELATLLGDTRVRCTYVDSRDHLWVCTYGKGLLDAAPDGTVKAYDAAAGFSDRVRTCTEAPGGTIVASGDNGVALVQGDKVQSTIPYGSDFSSSQVLCFLNAPDGTVLSGTDGDGIVAVKDGKVAWRATTKEGLSSNIILRIVAVPSGDGYLVVTSNGLCHLNAGHAARVLDNFPYFNNFDVQVGADGELFVLSSAGIYVVDEEALLGDADLSQAQLLDAKFGLTASITANSWNCQTEAGELYVSCDLGVFRLDTRDYAEGKRSYRMKLSTIALDSVEHQLKRGTTFDIDHDASRIDIYPEVITYTLDDPYVSYQLVGYDQQPRTIRASELNGVSYTNVGAGEYVFRVQVLDGDGNATEEIHCRLHKAPMFYDSVLFKLYLYAVAGAAIAWLTGFTARVRTNRQFELQQRELDLAHRQIQMADQTVLSIARAVDAKDENTSQHSHRVSEYSVLLARELGFSDKECENLRKAALLHDIGKIGIPDAILNKPARLTDDEYFVMKTHVSRGADILKDFTMIDHVVEGALYHHERYDGRGYVNGLAGEEIPLYGRIIAVADAFDAMTQNRVYRQKQDLGYVLGELERGKGTQFDPEIATIMLRLIDEGKIDHILYGTDEDEGEGEEESS